MANSVGPDQTAPVGAVWSGSALIAHAILLESFVYKILWHLPYFSRYPVVTESCANCIACCFKWTYRTLFFFWLNQQITRYILLYIENIEAWHFNQIVSCCEYILLFMLDSFNLQGCSNLIWMKYITPEKTFSTKKVLIFSLFVHRNIFVGTH